MIERPRRPSALVAGNRVRILAPSGPVDADRLRAGLSRLGRGRDLELLSDEGVLARDGYFAGDDAARLSALQGALDDPETAVVWVARGGYGATRLLGKLDASGLRAYPKTIVGFSDATALLAFGFRHGIASLHGPVVGQLGELADDDVERCFDLLEGRIPNPLVADEGTVVGGGQVEGWLCPANLEVLRSLVGTRHMPALAGAILAIEEVGERPYRIDRALTQLHDAGAFVGIRGVAVGLLKDCVEPENGGSQGASAEEVVVERLGRLGVPIVTGFGFGHNRVHNPALPFGTAARLDADAAALVLLEPLTVLP